MRMMGYEIFCGFYKREEIKILILFFEKRLHNENNI